MEEVKNSVLNLKLDSFKVEMISNRGARIHPDGMPETFCIDQWRVRFRSTSGSFSQADLSPLIKMLTEAGLDIIKLENLYDFDGNPGYSSPRG